MESGFVKFLNNKKKRDSERQDKKTASGRSTHRQISTSKINQTKPTRPKNQEIESATPNELTSNDGGIKALISQNSGQTFSATQSSTPQGTKIEISRIPQDVDKNSIKKFLYAQLNQEGVISYKRTKENNKTKIQIETTGGKIPRLIYNGHILKVKRLINYRIGLS